MGGQLVEGAWTTEWYDTGASGGRFVRDTSKFRNWITPDGGPGPSGEGGFAAESGRYHLYVALACPWAHRTLILRALKGLEDKIGVSVVHPLMLDHGWTFERDDKATGDPLHGAKYLHELYTRAVPDVSGRVTVPVLWDKKRDTIVSNESAEIVRMFNTAFDGLGATAGDYYPEDLREEVDRINARVYDTVNNGVYKAGFATEQDAYEEAVTALFESLDWLEGLLSERRYVAGDTITEADWRLFTTLIRFDPVYHGHFKCNIRRLKEYPNLWAYLRELYQWPGVGPTVDFGQIKRHYYGSHGTINPTGIVPVGPDLSDLDTPHGRG